MRPLDDNSLGLRYLRVARYLKEKIVEGEYQPGELMPRQHEMARQFGVAFATLKQALDLLERNGYVVRKVGQGTYAALPENHTPVALIVDDEASVTRFLKKTLKSVGWDSVDVQSGDMALEELRKQSFELIFLDLLMPGLTGSETFRRMRAVDADVNVVIITSYPNSEAMDAVLNVGPFTLMKKPFDREDVNAVIKRATNGSQESMRRL